MTPESKNNDQKILSLIQLENKMEAGFRLLVNEHQESVYSHVRRMVENHEDAADVMQNIFMKVYSAIEKFEGRSKISTWLYRIATNEALSFLKANKKNRNQLYAENHLAHLKAEVFMEESEIVTLLKKAISVLPERQKLVFNMRYFDEMRYEEIAEILNLKVGGLKASFHHAVKKIENYVMKNQMT